MIELDAIIEGEESREDEKGLFEDKLVCVKIKEFKGRRTRSHREFERSLSNPLCEAKFEE